MTMNIKRNNIVVGFLGSSKKFPSHPALEVDGQVFTYQQLEQSSRKIALAIQKHEMDTRKVAAIFAYRSYTAYSGILGVLFSGKGYVPLNPDFPLDRTRNMVALSRSNVIIVGKECWEQFKELLPLMEDGMTVILPDITQIDNVFKDYPKHKFVLADEVAGQQTNILIPDINEENTAYLLFTSGSTGIPKGIAISHMSVYSYVEYICQRYNVNEHDRFSQAFDMTFDLSVHDMFVCWQRGACLYCIPKKFMMAPAKFIREKELTMWFSVPSVAMFMSRMRMLTPDAYPSLRFSLFCGEALSASLAQQWQEAAPKSIVENLYGPTEATIAISHYTWKGKESIAICKNGIVPIGRIFDGQKYCIIDEQFCVVENGREGELCLNGTQITDGYLNDSEKTKTQFIRIPSQGEGMWYRTGDLVKEDREGCLHYLGRIDNQVQILGHRVELQEVDHALREATGTEMALSIAWPKNGGTASGIVGFIGKQPEADQSQIVQHCKKVLPEYMVPQKIYFIDTLPLNSNGKMDRNKLEEMLKMGKIG